MSFSQHPHERLVELRVHLRRSLILGLELEKVLEHGVAERQIQALSVEDRLGHERPRNLNSGRCVVERGSISNSPWSQLLEEAPLLLACELRDCRNQSFVSPPESMPASFSNVMRGFPHEVLLAQPLEPREPESSNMASAPQRDSQRRTEIENLPTWSAEAHGGSGTACVGSASPASLPPVASPLGLACSDELWRRQLHDLWSPVWRASSRVDSRQTASHRRVDRLEAEDVGRSGL
ncbi:hypothetical protein PINS_up014280 [Pythium insidiosum]|nr:hypothetical protein PINS_up014280 [Pythium insidiosum]